MSSLNFLGWYYSSSLTNLIGTTPPTKSKKFVKNDVEHKSTISAVLVFIEAGHGT